MSRVCDICGKGPVTGNRIIRHGKPKKQGGIGLHTTAVGKRRFLPNLKKMRIEKGGSIKNVKICTSCIRAGKVKKV